MVKILNPRSNRLNINSSNIDICTCVLLHINVCVCRLYIKSWKSVAAGVAGALLNKHSTPVSLYSSSPLPFPSSCTNTLFLTDTKLPDVKNVHFSAWLMVLCSLWQRIRAAFVPLTSLYYPFPIYFLIFPWLCACTSPLSLPHPPTVCLSLYFHWLVFEGLICFSPAAVCLFPLPSPSSCASTHSFDFLIAMTWRVSSELLKQTCVTLTITSWRLLSAQNLKGHSTGQLPSSSV